jgi:hypothetical protein
MPAHVHDKHELAARQPRGRDIDRVHGSYSSVVASVSLDVLAVRARVEGREPK